MQATTHVLETEVRTYHKYKAQLLQEHAGEWVLIQGKSVVDWFPTQDAAVDAGYALNDDDFFTQLIQEKVPVRHMVSVGLKRACQ